MSIATVRSEVEDLLAQANEKLARAQQMHTSGTDAQKVAAAGRLVSLQRQKQALDARMAELDHAQGGETSQWFKEDWMLLMQRLDAFMAGR
jgi:hypothetical protein